MTVDDVRVFSGRKNGADVPSTDQRAKRAYARYTDQHGRYWGAVIENKTGDPCGPLEPHFSAPIRALDKYITIDSYNRQLNIRYADIILDIARRAEEWHNELVKEARREYGQKAAEAIENPPPGLLDLVGPPPPPREPWEAAMQGNRWILGLTDVKPEWAEEFFPSGAEETRMAAVEITRHYPDADEEPGRPKTDRPEYPKWNVGKLAWEISEGNYLERYEGEHTQAYKARAEKAVKELQEAQ